MISALAFLLLQGVIALNYDLAPCQIKSYSVIIISPENFASVVEMYRTGEFHIPDSSNCKYRDPRL